MENQFKAIGRAIKVRRMQLGWTGYKASLKCLFGSNSGFTRAESGRDFRVSSLLRISKGMDLAFIIKDGKIQIHE